MTAARRRHAGPLPAGCLAAIFLAAISLATWPWTARAQGPAAVPDTDAALPPVRRIYVPVDRPRLWPQGDWQPVALSELDRQIDASRAARRPRPSACIEQAEYAAKLVGDELVGGRLEWLIRQPDARPSLLALGRLNLNVSQLYWADTASKAPSAAALWGADPKGTTIVVVDRPHGRLAGEWVLAGRRLAGGTEFEFELPSAETSRIVLEVPAGLMLVTTTGELSKPVATADAGWNEWRIDLGSQTTCRLRTALSAETRDARPLTLVRDHLNYFVRSEAVRVLAEFDVDVLESTVRDLRFLVDPDIQVTAIECGDAGAVAWESVAAPGGPQIAVRLPDPVSGAGHTLQIQGIAQVKQFAPWTLPRIRLLNAVEAGGRVTLRMQPPFQAADIRIDGYRQVETTTGPDEGEVLVFRQLRRDGTIMFVPADTRPDLGCHSVTLVEPDRQQWSMISQWEWKVASGSTFGASYQVSESWEVVDVRLAGDETHGELSGWEVQETAPGRRTLQLFFPNAVKPGRPQRVRISARRLPPAAGEVVVVPPLVPLDAGDIEQIFVVATNSEWRPVVELAGGIELLKFNDLSPEIAALDFLRARSIDRRRRLIVLKTVGTANGGLRVEPVEPLRHSGNGRTATDETTTRADDGPTGRPVAIDESATAVLSPVSIEIEAQVTGLSPGFDHYVARLRMALPARSFSFRWGLRSPAELIGVSLGGRRVVPLVDGSDYSISDLPLSTADDGFERGLATLEIEYRVPVTMHPGPNARTLVLPETERTIVKFDLSLVVSSDVRLADQPENLSLEGFERQMPWRSRLLGPFARAAGEPVFNPLRTESWASFFRPRAERGSAAGPRHFSRTAGGVPPNDLQLVIWNAAEVAWLSRLVGVFCLLAGIVLRLAKWPAHRVVAVAGMVILGVLAFVLPPVTGEFAGSALTGVVLAALAPCRFLAFAQRPAAGGAADVPVGSTQSFVPLAFVPLGGLALAFAGAAMALAGQAQDQPAPAVAAKAQERRLPGEFVDVLVPVQADGKPAGKAPLAYVSADLLTRLKRLDQPATMPSFLIAASAFDGTLDEANRLLVSARFEVLVFSGRTAVPVNLPLGDVNLGGADACHVDGVPHPIVAGPAGRGLVVVLAGPEPSPVAPALPEGSLKNEDSLDVATRRLDAPAPVFRHDAKPEPGTVQGDNDALGPVAGRGADGLDFARHLVELRLYPAVDSRRGELSTATLTIPPGCRTRATLSSPIVFPVMGIVPGQAGQPAPRLVPPGSHNAVLRPGPTNQLYFFWSSGRDPAPRVPAELLPEPNAEVEAGISCLADISPALIQMRYQIAYRVQSGRVDSLVWEVPAGYVIETVQAPQLAGHRFLPGENGGRRLLIEFSRPQTGDFSLSATFALAVDPKEGSVRLPLLDPLLPADGGTRQIGLRFHQIALRHPSDFRLGVAPTLAAQTLKPRPVDDFLKEWNAAGVRPQQAFDLERIFSLKLAIDSLPSVPVVRGSSIARFQSGRLDWTYNAELAQPVVPQFAYRLHIDPRLRITSISVQEDGADRLWRWSQLHETVVVFLTDRATRAQTVRVEATMPLPASQEFELPRARFVDALPGPERITLYLEGDVTVRMADSTEFPLSPAGDQATEGRRERLVAKLDVLPDQPAPRMRVDPLLPRLSAETATILEARGTLWHMTTCVAFQVTSGRVSELAIELPQALASRVEIRSLPESRISSQPAEDGRVKIVFHPDEPVLDSFVAILSGTAENPQPDWQLPALLVPGVEQTATFLAAPRGTFQPLAGQAARETTAVPEWVVEFVPALATGSDWDFYRWSGAAPPTRLRLTHIDTAQTLVDSAQLEFWVESDGSLEGWLGIRLAGRQPQSLDLDWPKTARPTGLFADGAFQTLPEPAAGTCVISLPAGASGRLVWISWVDPRKRLPLWSGPLSATVPWPQSVPVENCRVNLHLPPQIHVDASAPFAPSQAAADRGLAPPLVANAAAEDKLRSSGVSFEMMPVFRPGQPLDLGPSLTIVNERPAQWGILMASVCLLALFGWKTAPFWSWLVRHETLSWLVLSIFWWLCLAPSGLGLALAVWALIRAVNRKPSRPPAEATN